MDGGFEVRGIQYPNEVDLDDCKVSYCLIWFASYKFVSLFPTVFSPLGKGEQDYLLLLIYYRLLLLLKHQRENVRLPRGRTRFDSLSAHQISDHTA